MNPARRGGPWQAGRVQRWRGTDGTPSGWGRCVVTIGVFDGVHRGHQQIIGRAVARAAELGVPSLVLTFDPHPSEVVRPGSHPPMLTSPTYKADLLEQLGVDVVCVLPFTREFSRLTPDEFVHTVLVEHLHASAVVVGENFRYGYKAAGDVPALAAAGRRFGFTATGVPLVGTADTTWSSTYVRSCVQAGDVAGAPGQADARGALAAQLDPLRQADRGFHGTAAAEVSSPAQATKVLDDDGGFRVGPQWRR